MLNTSGAGIYLQAVDLAENPHTWPCTGTSWYRWMMDFIQTTGSPEIKMLRYPCLESPRNVDRYRKTLEMLWNSEVVAIFWFKYCALEKRFIIIHCTNFCSIWM